MKKIFLFLVVLSLLAMTGCVSRMTPARLFEKNVTYCPDNKELLSPAEYTLKPYDVINLEVYSNKGISLLPLSEEKDKSQKEKFFVIQPNGKVFVPYIGWVDAAGKSLEKFKDSLITLYSQIFVDPYVNVELKNKYILVFNGNKDQKAVAVPFLFTSPTLMEVLAQAGGLGNAKSSHVEIIRHINDTEIRVYKIDLSVAQNLPYSYVHLLPGDIVLLKGYSVKLQEMVTQLTPWLTLVSTFLLILTYLKP
jgi:polysaccharide export outer membrane protein